MTAFFSFFRLMVFCFLVSIFAQVAQGYSLDWKGRYNFEFVGVMNPDMEASKGASKIYGLHQLILRPNVFISDGINVYGQLHLLNNSEYPSSSLGAFWGQGLGENTTSPQDSFTSNVLSQQTGAGTLAVSQLYLSWIMGYSQLVVGRAPLDFGLGLTFNGGSGEFDHWFDSRDLIAYKIVSGNLSYTPMIASVNEGGVGLNDDVIDYIFSFEYDNKNEKTPLKIGLLYQLRKASAEGNDAPINGSFGIDDSSEQEIGEGWNSGNVSVYVERKDERSRLAVEAGFQNGETGVRSGGEEVTIQGFGVGVEWDFQPENLDVLFGVRAGYASGDNPETKEYEGYFFDKNYDVALLLFNHPLGKADVFRSQLDRGSDATLERPSSDRIDDQALSNALYISPNLSWQWTENLKLNGSFTYARLIESSVAGFETSLDLGYELDMGLEFQVHKNFKWLTQFGFVLPGDAFKGGGDQSFEKKSVYGVITKAAISF